MAEYCWYWPNDTQQHLRAPAIERLTDTRNRSKTFPRSHSVGEGKDMESGCLCRVLWKLIEQSEEWWGKSYYRQGAEMDHRNNWERVFLSVRSGMQRLRQGCAWSVWDKQEGLWHQKRGQKRKQAEWDYNKNNPTLNLHNYYINKNRFWMHHEKLQEGFNREVELFDFYS